MLIVHRCGCGHLDQWHRQSSMTGSAGCVAERCGCLAPAYGAPEVIPSWRGSLSGGTWPEAAQPPACDCAACRELFRQATATPAAEGAGGVR